MEQSALRTAFNLSLRMLSTPAAALQSRTLPHVMAADPPEPEQAWTALETLHRRALELLDEMDRLGLYEPGAYLAMAIDAIRRRHPDLRRD